MVGECDGCEEIVAAIALEVMQPEAPFPPTGIAVQELDAAKPAAPPGGVIAAERGVIYITVSFFRTSDDPYGGIGRQRYIHGSADAAEIVGAVIELHVATQRESRVGGADGHNPTHAVLSVEGALRAAQNFDLADVEQGAEREAIHWYAVDQHTGAIAVGFVIREAQATDRDDRRAMREVGEIHIGHALGNV